ncbi:hypothetical protein CTAYLR_008997 [Chrysophaeum taylorii]|uniref:Membrane transporter protein n=1 Tax=Chrysophaeum taylorii TaxID=2483200 RepID=A0AAD7ULD7_9STRA|nr:hypothetical protein CTAYLR_008997 [Chrysophaeum taylorii]
MMKFCAQPSMRRFWTHRVTLSRAVLSQPRRASSDVSKKMSLSGLGATGVVAGALGSLAGMGGGFVAIPMMTHFGVGQHVAHGTSLVGVLATGCAGAVAYGLDGEVDPLAALLVASTGALTARFGALAASRLEAQILKRALGVFMLVIAPVVPFKQRIMDLLAAEQRRPSSEIRDDLTSPAALVARVQELRPADFVPLLGIGVMSGFLAGLFGVGGGAIVVPLLALATDMDHKLALGTSLAAMVPTAVAGVAAHARLGNVQLLTATPLLVGTCTGAYFGGRLGSAYIPDEPMKLGFGVLMFALGSRTLITSFR